MRPIRYAKPKIWAYFVGMKKVSPARLVLATLALFAMQAWADTTRVLLFHKQNGYIHTATGDIVNRIKSDLATHGVTAESTVDSLAFTAQNLARFDAIVFVNTNYRNGALLTRAQESAFEAYVKAGGGFASVHGAMPLNGTVEETIWPWYSQLFGVRFRSHAPYQSGTLIFEDRTHFSTKSMPARLTLSDEWYATQTNPRNLPGVKVLATVDESNLLADSRMNGDHPMSWYRLYEGARTWVTLVGHDMVAFSNADFLAHVRGGILWAASADSVPTGLGRTRQSHRSHHRQALLARPRFYLRINGSRIDVVR